MTNNKIVPKIHSTFEKIKSLEKEIAVFFKDGSNKEVDKYKKIEIGSKVFEIQSTVSEFKNLMDLFFDLEIGTVDDLSQEVNVFYNQLIEIQKPSSEINDETLRKFKEHIENYKPPTNEIQNA